MYDPTSPIFQEVLKILIGVAKLHAFISYSDLVFATKTFRFTSGHDPRLWKLLGAISEHEYANGRPLLSVLVVHKNGDLEPGRGFFDLAKYLKLDTSDPTLFWITEYKKVIIYWK